MLRPCALDAERPGSNGCVDARQDLGGLSGLKPSVLPQPPLASSDDPTWARALVEQTAEGMGAGEFRAAQGKACETCPVRSSCPVQPEGDAL